MSAPAAAPPLDDALLARLGELRAEGRALFDRFERDVREREFHPFVPADYDRVLDTLVALRQPGLRFLELGSATGVITIMADMLGYEAFGIELDAELVSVARGLAERFGSGARFAAGSFLPDGYAWRPPGGDGRTGTIGSGAAAYGELRHPLADFDVVYGYPWDGEEPMMHDLVARCGASGARLLLHGGGVEGVRVYRGGVREA